MPENEAETKEFVERAVAIPGWGNGSRIRPEPTARV